MALFPNGKPTWLPDRKVYAGGIGGVAAWGLFAASSTWLHIDIGVYLQPVVDAVFSIMGIVPCPSAQGGLAIFIGGAIAYFMPPSDHDIYKKLNDRLVGMAVADPTSPVTQTGIAVAVNKAAVNAGNGNAAG